MNTGIILATAVLLLMTACGGNGTGVGDNASNWNGLTVNVAISPAAQGMKAGESKTFTVTATNTDFDVSVSPETGGEYERIGNSVIFKPTSRGTYTLTATAKAYTAKKATADVTVTLADPSIRMVPESVMLAVGDKLQFKVDTEIPVGQPDAKPSFALDGSCGTIDQTGAFAATAKGRCTVKASITDIDNKTVTATADVTVTEPGVVKLGGMVFVEGGTFVMGCTSEQGSDCEPDEKPSHSVTLNSFYIGDAEVTQAQWKAVMGSNPSESKGDAFPVENVSWNDVQEFLARLNEAEKEAGSTRVWRLPTEAEWEYAARGGTAERRCGGRCKYSGSNTADDVAWFDENSGGSAHPVKTKAPNDLGLYDMSGNVWEWVSDWHGSYGAGAQTDPAGAATGPYRVIRGGGWDAVAAFARVPNRSFGYPDNSGDNGTRGFRLASGLK
jgi:formylglycine-generating enzyme required for sulfatase activity